MARERKKPEEPNELRWLTTYADVVTLLMAFFVMLYAISQVDQTKFQLFVSGLADPFDNPAVCRRAPHLRFRLRWCRTAAAMVRATSSPLVPRHYSMVSPR